MHVQSHAVEVSFYCHNTNMSKYHNQSVLSISYDYVVHHKYLFSY